MKLFVDPPKIAKSLWSKALQNLYSLEGLRHTTYLIVFLVPPEAGVTGGLMSIYSLCHTSREICPDSVCLVVTWPAFATHASNRHFKNSEKVYRWKQIVSEGRSVERMVFHVPEFYAGRLRDSLDAQDVAFLKAIPELHINILNQNIDLMPQPAELRGLLELTPNLTQTTAHHRYATQSVCNRWGIPAHLFSVHIDVSAYRPVPFCQKRKTLVLSPDQSPHRDAILARLKEGLPDYRQVVVRGLTFGQYMELVAHSRFSVTFGEGFDGYFADPFQVGGLGVAVYNDVFFPDRSWLEMRNVYVSPEQMLERIVEDIRFLEANPQEYEALSTVARERLRGLYRFDEFKDNLRRFYRGDYDFWPDPPPAWGRWGAERRPGDLSPARRR